MYKTAVRGRENTFYKQLGIAVITVVEESDMKDYADMLAAREMADGGDNWDCGIEDALGENQSFFDMVFTIFWKYMVGF